MTSVEIPLSKTVSSAPAGSTFSAASAAVVRRMVLRKWVLGLVDSWWWMVTALMILVGLRFLLGNDLGGVATAAGLMGAWALAVLLWVWVKRPGAYAAFAFWDKKAGRADAFANAWWLEQQVEPSMGGRLHVGRQRELLESALKSMKKDIPLPDGRKLLLPLLALAGMFFVPSVGGWRVVEPELSAEAKKLAGTEGRKLEERKLDADKMGGLTEVEKEEVKKLQQKVDETAQSLQEDGSKSARDVLSELEKRARDAERLAEKMGAGDAAWASDQMVAEMRRHVDTAELGDAVAARSADNTAKQAEGLAERLNDEKLTEEARERFTETFKEIGNAGLPEDKERTVGQHVMAADRNMTQSLPKEAGGEMEALADKMRTLAQRDKAREQLEKLAQQLRDSGSSIAGQGQQGGMQELAGNSDEGQQGQQGQGQGQSMTAMPNAPSMSPMQMPGMDSQNSPGQQGQGQGQQGQKAQMMTPVPGAGQQGQSMAVMPGGTEKPKDGQPMLMAPVPGSPPPPPGQQPNAMMIMGVMPGMSQGGLQSGNGTTDLGKQPGADGKSAAGQSGMVNAQRNAEGTSSVRTIEGQARKEEAGRSSQETALEAIAAEESALDDAALPASRREQVRRYFNELRKRFERGS
ncbi:hypothetical protein [Phragmitibacter flavus]|nr:hypothetical protein [Phragmitibacter flavus]